MLLLLLLLLSTGLFAGLVAAIRAEGVVAIALAFFTRARCVRHAVHAASSLCKYDVRSAVKHPRRAAALHRPHVFQVLQKGHRVKLNKALSQVAQCAEVTHRLS